MTVEIQFAHVHGVQATTKFDVIFIHGITGDPMATWTNSKAEFWPAWLEQDLPQACIYTAGYPSSLFEKWAKKEMNLHERAASLLEHLVSANLGKRPIVFVCHSLGGLLAKEIYRAANESQDEDWNALADQLKLIVFIATPHKGSDLAGVIKYIAPRISSSFTDLLSGSTGYIADQYNSYRDCATKRGLNSIAYYEKHKVKGITLVVSPESADPGALKTRPIAIDADHISICKPETKDSTIYISILRHLKKVCDACPIVIPAASDSPFDLDDYSLRAEHDRRTLQEKLIDAGREHEYPVANELQNKFARNYYKNGLFTEEKRRNDSILAEVEQRFQTHVYGPKICAGASHEEIGKAIQESVIDPLLARPEMKGANHKAVLQAIYYLTEQCHIQWDKPS